MSKIDDSVKASPHPSTELPPQIAPAASQPQVVYMQPQVQYMPVHKERYCGPLSWVIGCLVFPCICFCPIDEREVRAVPVMQPGAVAMQAPVQAAPPRH